MTDLLSALASLLIILGGSSFVMLAGWHHSPGKVSFFVVSRALKGVFHIPEDEGPIEDLIEILGSADTRH